MFNLIFRKNIFLLPLLVLTVLSCSQTETLEECDLEEYFYQIEHFSEPQIHVFTRDSLGSKSRVYLKIEKIESNRLQICQYDDNFKLQSRLVDEFSIDGVDLISTEYNAGNGKMKNGFIESGRIYNFGNNEPKCEILVTYSGESTNQFSLKIISTIEKTELTEKTINGKSINTIVARGFTSQHEKYSGYSSKSSLTIWYTKGVGITLIQEEYANGIIKQEFVKIINQTEFDSLIKKQR